MLHNIVLWRYLIKVIVSLKNRNELEKNKDLLESENTEVLDSTDKIFDKFQIDTTRYKFNRDEANERYKSNSGG